MQMYAQFHAEIYNVKIDGSELRVRIIRLLRFTAGKVMIFFGFISAVRAKVTRFIRLFVFG